MLLFHEFEGTGYFSQVNEHSSGRVKKPDNGLATAIYLHMYMHVLCMYFVVLYFIDLPNKQTNKSCDVSTIAGSGECCNHLREVVPDPNCLSAMR